jgi:hypothetical protein
MSKWINEKREYIRPDFELAKIAPDNLKETHLFQILGKKEVYSISDAKKLNKRQFTIVKYKELMDLENGYSTARMLEILKFRCKYLIERGSTLNNPHIPASYFNGWERITENHAQRLKELVNQSFKI